MLVLETDSASLGVRQTGEGPVAIFVHGFPSDSSLWLDQIEALADIRTCVAVDLRGFGSSQPISGEPLTMEMHASDVDSIADALAADQIDLVGLSMGGYVALAFAELFGHRLRSLALMHTRSGADGAEARANREVVARRALEEGRIAFAKEVEELLLGPDASMEARARLRSMAESTQYEAIVGAQAGMAARPDRTHVLSTVTGPSVVIAGGRDRVVSAEEGEAMARELPAAQFHVIDEVGHMSPLERPSEVNVLLRHLFERTE